jgi:hypothetical protein
MVVTLFSLLGLAVPAVDTPVGLTCSPVPDTGCAAGQQYVCCQDVEFVGTRFSTFS